MENSGAVATEYDGYCDVKRHLTSMVAGVAGSQPYLPPGACCPLEAYLKQQKNAACDTDANSEAVV